MILLIALVGAFALALGFALGGNAGRVCHIVSAIAFGIALAMDLFSLA